MRHTAECPAEGGRGDVSIYQLRPSVVVGHSRSATALTHLAQSPSGGSALLGWRPPLGGERQENIPGWGTSSRADPGHMVGGPRVSPRENSPHHPEEEEGRAAGAR